MRRERNANRGLSLGVGYRQKLINQSEGDRQSAINMAQGSAESVRLSAQAQAQAIRLLAEAEADASRLKADASADGLRAIALAVAAPGGEAAVRQRLAEAYIDAVPEIAKHARMVIVPDQPNNVAAVVATALGIAQTTGTALSPPAARA